MSGIKLSICIPTYNREAYLRNALEHCETYDFDFPYEIVISDNASTDNTAEVVEEFIARGLPIRLYRRAVNGGPYKNIASSFHHAVGEYSIYLADDDFLIPEGVKAAVAYLDANSDVSACHAPWYLYDEINDRDLTTFYKVDEDTKFGQHDFVEVFQFLFERHIFPEIAIYRSSALRSVWVPRDFCFCFFPYLAHVLDQSGVAFLKQPFYRSVVASKVAPDRSQTGNEEVMVAWDKYRGGLEYFLYMAAKRGKLSTTPEARAIYEEMCKVFTLNRMAVAVRFWAVRKDFIKAYELYTRIALGGMGDHPEVAALRESFPMLVAMQTLAYQVTATAGVDRLILSGMADPALITELLRDVGLPPEIDVTADLDDNDPIGIENTMIFAADMARRETFLERGYKPNMIFIESDLTQHILI
ncbi:MULTISPECIES: glycosyltransferase family 2 protein [unclassified Rhizobium]|uniref:glycosyltransferase family 2 protein n=1 Tax=unclassified Rhizobium TaxID=2613769 RepID=UPI00160736DE|nr:MULTISPECIES: glycosyltransferase family 2 protein [unclassified Rhizobium]MBB3543629.1 glycosyltransferase domain-containing protein [Rhizobium sp. BK399]MCS3741869.1 glycosyltransferase domain-containing protein [Rhizobium sp. BK661]MCS4095448.1 glycosyltransferase domain-containing protein [Rhizobium sp. BK176]